MCLPVMEVMQFPDVSIDLGQEQEKLLAKATQLVLKVRTEWSSEAARSKVFSGGISNILVGIYQEGNKDDMVLVRVYGVNTEVIIDREAEIRNMKLFHASGCGPALLATFANGIAYEFVPGRIFDVDMAPDPKFNQPVVEMLARMHRMPVADGARPEMWNRLRKFLSASPDGGFAPGTAGADEKKAARFRECGIMSRSELAAEVDELEKALSGTDSPVVHCHMDLLLGNIVYNEKSGKVTFIDHEYGTPNYQAFDLGNHFVEFVGVDGELDYNRYYPSEAVQLDWLRRYLRAYNSGKEPTDKEVRHLYVETNKFALCAHLKWGIWALVQAKNSTIDFDFIDYARQRLDEYKKRKQEFLSLQ